MKMIDGKAIAKEEKAAIRTLLTETGMMPRLCIITCAPTLATESYLALKEKNAAALGITVVVRRLLAHATTAEAIAAVAEAAVAYEGVIVQLPLPPTLDTEAILAAIPPAKDVDNFRYRAEPQEVLPPVVYAIDAISQREGVSWSGKTVVIFGAGRLVGHPMAHYAAAKGAQVTVLTEQSSGEDMKRAATADIIVLGVGKPRLLTKEMVKDGVVVFDAGASEDGGLLVGDADPAVAEKASLFTPVPGGIGPITVAALFRNLLTLALRQ